MSKYSDFIVTDKSKFVQLGDAFDGFTMYDALPWGRYVLVKNGKEVAFKNKGDFPPSIDKWVETWRTNARKQLDRLEGRIEDLQTEQNEISHLLIHNEEQA